MRMRGAVESVPLRLSNNRENSFGRKLQRKRIRTRRESASGSHHFDEIRAELRAHPNRACDTGCALHFAPHEVAVPSQRSKWGTAKQQIWPRKNTAPDGGAQRKADSVPVSAIARRNDAGQQKHPRVLRRPQQQRVAVFLHHRLARSWAAAQRPVNMSINQTGQKSRVFQIDNSR